MVNYTTDYVNYLNSMEEEDALERYILTEPHLKLNVMASILMNTKHQSLRTACVESFIVIKQMIELGELSTDELEELGADKGIDAMSVVSTCINYYQDMMAQEEYSETNSQKQSEPDENSFVETPTAEKPTFPEIDTTKKFK